MQSEVYQLLEAVDIDWISVIIWASHIAHGVFSSLYILTYVETSRKKLLTNGVIAQNPCITQTERRLIGLGYLFNVRVNISARQTQTYQYITSNLFILTLRGHITCTNVHVVQHRNYINKKLGSNQVIDDYY